MTLYRGARHKKKRAHRKQAEQCQGYRVTYGSQRSRCAHYHCDECDRLSADSTHSDFWICCRCQELNRRKKEKKAVQPRSALFNDRPLNR